MRAFHGLCQQMGNFSQSLAATLLPLAPLLKKNYQWEWTSHHESSFNEARKELSSSAELSFYDPALPTALHVDASRLRGLGFVLRQQSLDGKWNVVQAGSRFLSDAETRYAMIELECLGAAWAMQKCRQFLEGLPSFLLLTDHRPLIPILNEYSLDKLDNPRILRLRLKMQRYSFTARWIPGKENLMADALSRAPVHLASPNDELAEVPPSADACISLLAAITGSDDSLSDPLLKDCADHCNRSSDESAPRDDPGRFPQRQVQFAFASPPLLVRPEPPFNRRKRKPHHAGPPCSHTGSRPP